MINSPLTWIGGKAKIRNWIVANFPTDYNLYIEPFCGAAWVYFAIGPRPAVLNDINSEIVNFFECLRIPERRKTLVEMLRYTPYSRELFEKLCETPFPDQPIKRAWHFFVLCRMCYSGGGDIQGLKSYDYGVSTRSYGRWRPTKGRMKTDAKNRNKNGRIAECASKFIRPIEQLDEAAEVLQTAVIENLDFRDLLSRRAYLKEYSFVYCDPPYIRDGVILDRYYGCDFSEQDFVELAEILNQWPGPVMFSNYHGDIWNDLFPQKKWRRVYKKVYVCASGLEKKRAATEMLIMNYEPRQGVLFKAG